ncbi:uncharacterized protein LOC117178935 isoform X2 [Belonocnema kinseyi]|nr:uncharacterized protein LOC117178935 isoform X2 [Belonocnema kinseyi]XP_033226399.1 uncharacterized protein LOC117178935 isoform X2 [Belonocnema kinseyi]
MPQGPASTSGRKTDEVPSPSIHTEELKLYTEVGVVNDEGIFYEENGKYYPVQKGIPLLEHSGFIIGRPSNGLVAPIFNSEHKPVRADQDIFNFQHPITKEEYRKYHFFERIPSYYHVVNLLKQGEPEPELEVSSHFGEIRLASYAPAKKSGKKGKKKNRASK